MQAAAAAAWIVSIHSFLLLLLPVLADGSCAAIPDCHMGLKGNGSNATLRAMLTVENGVANVFESGVYLLRDLSFLSQFNLCAVFNCVLLGYQSLL